MESILLQSVPKKEYKRLVDKIDKIHTYLEAQALTNNEKLSVREVSKELGVTEVTVYRWIKKGVVKAFKIGNRVYIKRLELDNALTEVKSLKYKR